MGKEINEIDNYYTKELAEYNTIFDDAKLFLRTLIIWHKNLSKEKFSTLPRRKELGYFTSGAQYLETNISQAFNELTIEFKEFFKGYSKIMNSHLTEISSLVSNNENVITEYLENLAIRESQKVKRGFNNNRIKSLDSIYLAIKLYQTTFEKYNEHPETIEIPFELIEKTIFINQTNLLKFQFLINYVNETSEKINKYHYRDIYHFMTGDRSMKNNKSLYAKYIKDKFNTDINSNFRQSSTTQDNKDLFRNTLKDFK
jgi:hypothetical protein